MSRERADDDHHDQRHDNHLTAAWTTTNKKKQIGNNTKNEQQDMLKSSSKASRLLAANIEESIMENKSQIKMSKSKTNETQKGSQQTQQLAASLRSAANEGKVELVRLLLRCGADVNGQDEEVSVISCVVE